MSLFVSAISVIALFIAPSILAQTDDSRVWIQQPGVAMVQDFPSSPPRLRRFDAFLDQTAVGYSGRGFYVFHFEKSSQQTKLPASLVKLILVKPDLPDPLLTESDRSTLVSTVNRFGSAAKAYPSFAASIMAMVDELAEAINSYDAGSVFVNGVWMNRIDYLDKQVADYESQLRAEMDAAPSKKAFDYTRNPFYLEIKSLSSDPYIAERLKNIEADFSAILALENLENMIAELDDPKLPTQRTTRIIGLLTSLKEPSPAVSRILEQSKKTAELNESIDSLRRSMNSLFSSNTNPASLPKPPTEIVGQAQSIMSSHRILIAGRPPAAFKVPVSEAQDLAAIAENLTSLQGLLDSKNYKDAGDLAERLVSNAASVGTPTKTGLLNIQTHCVAQTNRIDTLRTEAEQLAKSGKKKDAAAKLTEALEISPNQELEKQLKALLTP